MKYILPALLLFMACQRNQTQSQQSREIIYKSSPQAITLSGTKIKEASGITYSKSMPGKLWVNQDSGNPPLLYLLDEDGKVSDSLLIEGAMNRDWEDITSGKGPAADKNYLYIGDIGDNEAKYPSYTIYRFEEPGAGAGSITTYEKIEYTYADGARDAEALIVDEFTKDIFIISKRDAKSRIYRLAFPQSTTANNVAEFLFELNYNQVVSAAVSPNNDEIIIKTYAQVYHYKKEKTSSPDITLRSVTPRTLAYQVEPQGEAVAFRHDAKGFYTLSEEALDVEPKLFFYEKVEN